MFTKSNVKLSDSLVEAISEKDMLKVTDNILSSLSNKRSKAWYPIINDVTKLKYKLESNEHIISHNVIPEDNKQDLLKKKLGIAVNEVLNSLYDTDINLVEDQKIRILFTVSNTTEESELELAKEIKKIKSELENSKLDKYIDISENYDATYNDLEDKLLDFNPHYVHLSGHGSRKGIRLKKDNDFPETISNEVLTDLFKLFEENISLIFLNYCESYEQAEHLVRYKNKANIIGMTAPIQNNHAIVYAKSFYKAIGAGRDVKFASELGRIALKRINPNFENVPRLYFTDL